MDGVWGSNVTIFEHSNIYKLLKFVLKPIKEVTADGGVPYYQYFCSFHPLPPVRLTGLAPHSLHLITYNEGRTFALLAKPGKKTNVVDFFAKILGLKELSEVNSPKICVYLQYSEHTDWQQCGVFGTHKDFKALLWFFVVAVFAGGLLLMSLEVFYNVLLSRADQPQASLL